MAELFDPYHRWLGIPPKDQPPHFYRLLGLDLFESDPEMIRDAVERQIAHVRRYQLGQHSQLSQRILNELAEAKACLSDPNRRAEYDRGLRRQLAAVAPITPPVPAEQPPVSPPSLRAKHGEAGSEHGLRSHPPQPPQLHPGPPAAASLSPPRVLNLPALAVVLAAAVASLVALVAIFWITWPSSPEQSLVAQDSPLQKEPEALPPPVLAPIPDVTTFEGQQVQTVIRPLARSGNPQRVRYHLAEDAPSGAQIDPHSGQFSWTPTEAQGPADYRIPIVAVAEDDENRRAQAELHIQVRESNEPPTIRPIGTCLVEVNGEAQVVVVAADPDQPANKLVFRLLDGPPGGTITPTAPNSCTFRWHAGTADAGKTYHATVEVTDNGVPPRSDRGILTISVKPAPEPAPPAVTAKPSANAIPDRTARAADDDRIGRMERILETVSPMFQAWKIARSQEKDLMGQLRPVMDQLTQLSAEAASLERKIQSLNVSVRTARFNNDDSAAQNYLRQINDCQRQIAAIQGPLRAAAAEKARLDKEIGDKQRQQAESARRADQSTQIWLAMCDPFGNWPSGLQQRVVDRANQWIAQEPELWMPYLARGFAQINLQQYELGLSDIERARELNEGNPRMNAFALAIRGRVFALKGDGRKALVEFSKAARIDPKLPILYMFRGEMYSDQQRYSEAESEFRKAVRLKDDVAESHNALALLLAASPHSSVRSGKEAVDHATRACELTGWKSWVYAETLAAAHAELGDFAQAAKFQNQAISLAPDEAVDSLRQRLSLYQAGKPYRLK